jgi:hypothetical protein
MDSAGQSASSVGLWRPWPAQSGADVVFLPGERKAAERTARRFFGRSLEACEYAGLAGAPDDARVEVGVLSGMLYVEVGDPGGAAYRAHYYIRRVGGRLALVNEGIRIHLYALRGDGLGLRMFHRQVANAALLGVHRIDAVAGRRSDENGYYTWPRFGFDGRLPLRLRRRLPAELAGARSVLDVTGSEQGRRWWREAGETIRVTFDLTPGSRSRATLDGYVEWKTGRLSS